MQRPFPSPPACGCGDRRSNWHASNMLQMWLGSRRKGGAARETTARKAETGPRAPWGQGAPSRGHSKGKNLRQPLPLLQKAAGRPVWGAAGAEGRAPRSLTGYRGDPGLLSEASRDAGGWLHTEHSCGVRWPQPELSTGKERRKKIGRSICKCVVFFDSKVSMNQSPCAPSEFPGCLGMRHSTCIVLPPHLMRDPEHEGPTWVRPAGNG